VASDPISRANPFRGEMAPTHSMLNLPRRQFLAAAVAGALGASCRSSSSGTSSAEDTASIGPLLAPATLAGRLADVKAGRLAVLYVGPAILFDKGRVPGARSIGALDSEEGRKALQTALAGIAKDTEVVLYCGCCPVKSCPNVRPASAAVRALGRPNAWVLDLPTRFATDWTEKGYPVERS